MIILGLLLLASAAANVVLFIRQDRLNAQRINQRTWLEAYLAKATADRRDQVRIPAADLKKAFALDGRALAAVATGAKSPGHPATLAPARRRKLGGAA
jgi:hypothetical protein